MNKIFCLVTLLTTIVSCWSAGQRITLRHWFGHSAFKSDGTSQIDVSFSNDYQGYSVLVNDQIWLNSAQTQYRNNEKWANPNLDRSQTHSGNDIFGNFDEMSLYWTDSDSSDGNIELITSFRMYNDDPTLILLTQSFPNGLKDTSVKDANKIITSFPSFEISQASNNSDVSLGYVHWSGIFTGYSTQYGTWTNDDKSNSLKGTIDETGPLCIVNSDFTNAIVISPLTNHMAASEYVNQTSKTYHCGIIGNVTSIPAGYQQTWMISLTKYGGGVNIAMNEWGNKQLKYYNVKTKGNSHSRDYTLNYLGYSTDHGTYYYYYTEPNKNYQETMIDVKTYLDKIGIPVKYVLLDSWWYYKGDYDGVKNWKAMNNIFPNGMEYVHNATKWPIQAHNRYWSINNIYANNNPSPYHNTGEYLFPFNWGAKAGLPKTRDFWDYLFNLNDNWGLIVYEQDWLSTAEDDVPQLTNNITFGENWLYDMGLSALDHDLSIQYCMAYPRHVLTSVGLESVTQTRASGDYVPEGGSSPQWMIGVSSIFASSIDLMPSKDSYWSMSGIQGNNGPYKNTSSEPYPRLQSCVLTLSNGPVTFGDAINYANKTLIMRACNENGLLLRPELPATMLENYFNYKSFENSDASQSFDGQIWVTNSIIGENIEMYQYFYVFVAILEKDYNVTLNDLMFQYDIMKYNKYLNENNNRKELRENILNSEWLVYEANTTDKFVRFNKDLPLTVKACGHYDFQLYTFVPLSNTTSMSNNNNKDIWFLSGEIDKWIAASKQRFSNIEQDYTSGEIAVTINGAIGEKVNVGFVNSNNLQSQVVSCVIGQNERAVVRMPNQTCTQF